ncbi:MAG: GNAT family N-acetyltransferase [Candidatus Aenigmarchaeota archaeon]|nr:GNAT family N-acetyltransferase [Candidatus Aenigmarchaeota archaeon]
MVSEQIAPYVQAAGRKLGDFGRLGPLSPELAEPVASFASQFEATEYDPQEVYAMLSAPNASYAVVDGSGKLAHISLAYPAEVYNDIWGSLGKLEDYGSFGDDLTDGRHFYYEAVATAPEYQSHGLATLASSLVEIEARAAGYEEMIYLVDEGAVAAHESMGARLTDRTKTMTWDGKNHKFYEMCKLLDDQAISKALQTIMTEEDLKQYVAQAKAAPTIH